jgi:hypothetical protein
MITKKEFKEKVSVHVYGKGKGRRVRLFFDWNGDPDVGKIGYKYMLLSRGITKDRIITDAYDILIKNENDSLCWYDIKIAQTDNDRFKVPLMG